MGDVNAREVIAHYIGEVFDVADPRSDQELAGDALAALTAAGLVILPRAVVMEAVEAMNTGVLFQKPQSLDRFGTTSSQTTGGDILRLDAARAKLMEAMRDE